MAELLLELFSEEIPHKAGRHAIANFERMFTDAFLAAGIPYESIKLFLTPRRVTLLVTGVKTHLEAKQTELRGPRTSAPDAAISGFLKSTGLSKEQLTVRNTDKGEFYFAITKEAGKETKDVLPELILNVLNLYTWPKSMRWGAYNIRWIRPLHNILCLFDGSVLPFTFGHLTSNDQTYGHRFLGSKNYFKVSNFDDYAKKLKAEFVILDQDERAQIIKEQCAAHATKLGIKIKEDNALLLETSDLAEWPVALIGKIDDKFMSLPDEVLFVTLKVHQRYFSLIGNDGKKAPYFITVANMVASDNGAKIIQGNGKVLSARLEDAKFFWEQDLKTKLENRNHNLEKIIFHAKIGTVAEKVARITELSKYITKFVPHAKLDNITRAASLCKSDLVTGMVGEFPELQGTMGEYYAINDGEDKSVAAAIREHYSPVGVSDNCPTNPVSVCVAIADKIDSLVAMFAINEKPTGSRDPYALRRSALGIIRIITENKIMLPLLDLIKTALSLLEKHLDKKIFAEINQQQLVTEIFSFFVERLKVSLKEKSIRHDIIDSVLASSNVDDLYQIILRVNALDEFLKTSDGKDLHSAYKRANSIVQIEEKKDGTKYNSMVSEALLQENAEKNIFAIFNNIKPIINDNLQKQQYALAMQQLAKLRAPIDDFFCNVEVNNDNAALRKNRLLLLAEFRLCVNNVADFGKIESL